MKWRFGIAAAVLASVSSVLWFLHDGSPSTAPPVTLREAPPRAAAPARAEPPSPSSERAPAAAPASTAVASDSPTAELAQAMAQRAYDNFGPRLVGYLSRQGLSRVDAEPIVAEMLHKTVSCTLDALREQALEQRVEFEQVLSALDAELYDTDGPLITAILDVGAASQRAMPCSMTALTQAGIPPQAASELLPRPRP
jgi:hypothetical protein